MTIAALKKNRIIPFECGDEELHLLFSYFLHRAPTVDSVSAINVPVKKLDANWSVYIKRWNDNQYKFYEKEFFSSKPLLLKYGLDDNSEINRLSRSFICTRENSNEKEYKCVLRHLRNAIAHGHVYYVGTENRKYVLLAITKELTDILRKSRTIDWQKKESARAGMRRMIKGLLKRYKYPPEGMEDAIATVIGQCEMWVDR